MSLDVIKHAEAERDLLEIADYYDQEGDLDLAERFLDAAEEAFRFLADFPEAGSPKDFTSPRLQGLRSWRVKGFEKLLIFYRPSPNAIYIVRVIHGARDIPTLLEEF